MAKRRDEELESPPEVETPSDVPFEEGPSVDVEPSAVLPMNYEAAWAALKDFAIKHRETRKTQKTFGETIEEFVFKIENGHPI